MTAPGTTPNSGHQDVGSIPVGQLMSKVAEDLSHLMRSELALAKVEVKDEVTKTGKASAALGGAALAGWFTLLFASVALMGALDAVLPLGWAALIVAALWGVAAAVLAVTGRQRIKQVNPVPERAVETLKEDVQWLQNRNS